MTILNHAKKMRDRTHYTSDALVSIVIPLYNAQEYIVSCIRSLEMQDYRNLEIIIVNDGSTDNSYQIIADYLNGITDSRFLLYDKCNTGPAGARNLGLQHCSEKSEYVIFVDSDDEIAPNLVSSLVHQASESTLSVGNIIRCTPSSRPDHNIKANPLHFDAFWENQEFLKFMQYGILNSSCAKCYSLKLIRENNLKFEKEFPEDTRFNIAYFSKIKNLIWIPDAKYYYYVRNNSVTSKPSETL